MNKYIADKKIDLLVPEDKIQQTAFLPVQKSYKTDQLVTKQEIQDSIIIKDSLFQYTSVCKMPVENAQIITKIPENSVYTYQVSDQRSIMQMIIQGIQKHQSSNLNQAVSKVLSSLYENFGIKDDPARQQALFVQISHLLQPGALDYDRYLKFLNGKLKHVETMAQYYPEILF